MKVSQKTSVFVLEQKQKSLLLNEYYYFAEQHGDSLPNC